MCKDLHDTQREKVAIASELGLMRIQLHHETNKMEDISKRMTEENGRLKRSLGLCHLNIVGLKTSIRVLNFRNALNNKRFC